MIHTSIRISANGDTVIQGIASSHVSSHIQYNRIWRGGQFFMVDGVVQNRGYYTENQAFELCKRWQDYKVEKLTPIPYH